MDALPDGSGRLKVEFEAPVLTHKTENTYHMPKVWKNTVSRVEQFRAAWRELAPDASFAGMTYAQFEAASAAPLELRGEILALEKQLEGRKTERSQVDSAADQVLDLVVNSVRGTPGFGEDCALYRAFGYVRKSERKSGLTRKSKSKAESADAA